MSSDAIRFRDSVIYPMATHRDRRKIEFGFNKQSLTDNLPEGAISFFDKLECPVGWTSYTLAGTRSFKANTSSIESTADGGHTHTVFCDQWFTNIVSGSGGPAHAGSPGSPTGYAGSNSPTITPAYIKYICCKKVVK